MSAKRVPIYKQVYSDLKQAIQTKYQVGDLLPPEPELEKQYNVSRVTIRKAIQMLSDECCVSVKQGHGTRVTNPGAIQRINYITSVSETLREAGYNVRSSNILVDDIIPDKTILARLELTEGTPVTRVQRLLLANEKPISIVTNYIVTQYAKGLAEGIETYGSLYNYLEKHNNVRFDSATDYITARSANMMQANTLELPINSPLIYIRRITFSNNKATTCDDLLIDASRYTFSVNLVGRPAQNGN